MRHLRIFGNGVLFATCAVLALALLFNLSAPFCLTTFAAGKEPIKIGYVNPSTGVFATIGKAGSEGVNLAVKKINEAGGVNGHQLLVIERDSAANPAQALRMSRELIFQEEVDVLIGGLSSSECLAISPFAEETEIAYMTSSGCWTDAFSDERCNRYAFRHVANDRQRIMSFARWLIENVGKTWYVAYSDFAYGQSGFRNFSQIMEEMGASIIGSVAAPLGTTDMAPYMSKVDTNADGLFMVFAGRDGVLAMKQIAELGLHKKMKITANQSILIRELWPKLPEAAEGLTMIAWYPSGALEGPLDTPYNRWFHDECKEFTGKELPGLNTIEGYTAINLLAKGMRLSGFQSRKDTKNLIGALEGIEVKESNEFPQGSFRIRGQDHQAISRLFVVQVREGAEKIIATIPADETAYPPKCNVK